MSGLFIRLYLDEDVSVKLGELLQSRGFDVITTLAASRLGSKDVGQLEYAVSKNRTFLTHNRKDFEALAQLYFLSSKRHSGIIIAVRRPVRELTNRLLDILNRFTADEMRNQILYI